MEQESNAQLRFSVDEEPPLLLSSMLAAQIVLLIVAGIVLTPAIVLRAAGMPVELEAGVIFFALLICGVTTMLQARRVWRIGAGYILLMGTSGAFIAVSVSALEAGGLALLMTLVIASSLIQFLLASKLGLLRRIITPLVGGTTIMLLAVTVMPIAFQQFSGSDGSGSTAAGAAVAGTTLLAILVFSFFGGKTLRLWAPLIGIIIGTALSAALIGLDTSRIENAPWFGIPSLSWQAPDLSFGTAFWVLLPAFIIVTLVGAIETFGDAIAVQKISRREPRPVDYRTVQGALYADGLGNLLSGVAGTVPNTTYSTSISVVDMTGVAARRVGLVAGLLLLALAFFPKLSAAVLSIPPAVVGSYLIVLILLLFMHGVRMVASDGLSYEKGFIVGMGFWLGMGFQSKSLFAEQIPDWLAPILGNGMTSGTLVTVLLVALLGLRQGRKHSLTVPLSVDSVPEVWQALEAFCARKGWHGQSVRKVRLAAEETLLSLIQLRSEAPSAQAASARWEFRAHPDAVEIDVAVAPVGSHFDGLLEQAKESAPEAGEHMSFKLLGMIARDFKHHQFNEVDFISLTVPVELDAVHTQRNI